MSDGTNDKDQLSPADVAWFDAGAPVPDDFIDPELSAGDDGGAGLGQGIILLLVAAFALLLAVQYTLELRYFFTPRTPIALNEGADEDIFIGPEWEDESGNLAIPSNRYAEVSAIPQRRSLSGDREFFALVGTELYVERRIEDDRPRVLQGTPRPVERGQESARAAYEGAGRVVSFRDLPRRYSRFIRYYSDSYRVHFCGFEPSEELRSYQFRMRRQAEDELLERLGRAPTEAEIRERTGAAGYCQEGYLLIDGEAPSDFWFYPLFYLAFLAIIAGAVFFVARKLRGRLAGE